MKVSSSRVARIMGLVSSMVSASQLVEAADTDAAHRVAVVVGANAAIDGRTRLRHAADDARAMAGVLVDVGRFAREDVQLLLDPEPAQIEAALERKLAAAAARLGPTLLLFYYSGHADRGALHPGGHRLELTAIRAKLEDPRAAVRLGILDACQGGAWTTAKGLRPDAPFDVPLPLQLENEGSILIASSSGQESAHEIDALGGSLFTHHLVAGLRGAADTSGDGAVTLEEAFDYARELTTRDAMILSRVPQHPSFHVRLKGRQELALTKLASAPSVVEVSQQDGPLEVVHLGLGLKLVELRAGRREVRLALPPGRYLIQRRVKAGAWAREFELHPNQVIELAEADLELRGLSVLVAKGAVPLPDTSRTTLPRLAAVFQQALGVSYGLPGFSGFSSRDAGLRRGFIWEGSASFGLTDRLQLVLPGLLAYRFGELGELEATPWGGVKSAFLSYSPFSAGFLKIGVAVGFDVRLWFGERASLGASAFADSTGTWSWSRGQEVFFVDSTGTWSSRGADEGLVTWRSSLRLVYSHTVGDLVTFNLGLGLSMDAVTRGELFGGDSRPEVWVGAVGVRAGQELPLVRFHVTDHISLDGWAKFAIDGERVRDTYLLGATFQF